MIQLFLVIMFFFCIILFVNIVILSLKPSKKNTLPPSDTLIQKTNKSLKSVRRYNKLSDKISTMSMTLATRTKLNYAMSLVLTDIKLNKHKKVKSHLNKIEKLLKTLK